MANRITVHQSCRQRGQEPKEKRIRAPSKLVKVISAVGPDAAFIRACQNHSSKNGNKDPRAIYVSFHHQCVATRNLARLTNCTTARQNAKTPNVAPFSQLACQTAPRQRRRQSGQTQAPAGLTAAAPLLG